MVSGPEPIGPVADHLGLVVEPFDRAVIDGHLDADRNGERPRHGKKNKK